MATLKTRKARIKPNLTLAPIQSTGVHVSFCAKNVILRREGHTRPGYKQMRIFAPLVFNVGQYIGGSLLRRMSKSALVILAPGAEEMEFVIATDVLRRSGVNVTVAGLNGTEPVKCSRDIVIVPDVSLESQKAATFDVVLLPGGLGGSKAMAESGLLGEVLKTQETAGRLVAAICAAPTALQKHGIGCGKSITSYPSFKTQLEADYKYVDDKEVVQDGNIITSRGPATAFAFGLKVAEELVGAEKVTELSKALLLQ